MLDDWNERPRVLQEVGRDLRHLPANSTRSSVDTSNGLCASSPLWTASFAQAQQTHCSEAGQKYSINGKQSYMTRARSTPLALELEAYRIFEGHSTHHLTRTSPRAQMHHDEVRPQTVAACCSQIQRGEDAGDAQEPLITTFSAAQALDLSPDCCFRDVQSPHS